MNLSKVSAETASSQREVLHEFININGFVRGQLFSLTVNTNMH